MEENVDVHDIYVINPFELLSYVEQFIKINLKNGEVISGTVYTIDPVSQSVVLVTKEKSGEMCLKIILKHSIASMEKLSEVPKDQQNIITSDIFKSNNKTSSSNETLKNEVKDWLIKNMIPVTECGEILQIDSLKIYPPYGVEQCYSDNSIVLSRIQNLLEKMPQKKV